MLGELLAECAEGRQGAIARVGGIGGGIGVRGLLGEFLLHAAVVRGGVFVEAVGGWVEVALHDAHAGRHRALAPRNIILVIILVIVIIIVSKIRNSRASSLARRLSSARAGSRTALDLFRVHRLLHHAELLEEIRVRPAAILAAQRSDRRRQALVHRRVVDVVVAILHGAHRAQAAMRAALARRDVQLGGIGAVFKLGKFGIGERARAANAGVEASAGETQRAGAQAIRQRSQHQYSMADARC